MKSVCSFAVLGFLMLSALSARVIAGNIEVQLPGADGGEAFQVQNVDGIVLMHAQSDGKVGIGTITPEATLDILGDAHFSSGVTVGDVSKHIDIFTHGADSDISSTTKLHLNYNNNQSVSVGEGGNSDLLVSGNIGIGTATPGTKLHVSGGDAAITTAGQSGLILTSPNGDCWRLTVSDSGTLSTAVVPCP